MKSFNCHNCKTLIEDDAGLIHGACYRCPHCEVFTVYNEIILLQSILQEVLNYKNGIGKYDVRFETDAGLTLQELWKEIENQIKEALSTSMGQN